MENFWNNNSQFSQHRVPTHDELKRMKGMLLSGNKEQILQAIEGIKIFANEEESLCAIIRADISESLCDVVEPLDNVTLSAISNCLELMSKHSEFYTHHHSCFAIESIIKSLQVLMKDSYSIANLNQSLNLLPIILQGCLVSSENSVEELCVKTDGELKSETIFNVCEFLIDFAASYFDNVTLSETEANLPQLENFYRTILYFYSDNLPHKIRLTHELCQLGFLQFTTRVLSFDEVSHTQKLPRLCMLVLFYIILSLSEDVFHFPEIWPRGRDNFRSEIQKGIVELPLDPSQWLDVLVSPHSSPSCKVFLLLYLYFYCLTAKSHAHLQVIYPAIVTFVHYSTGIETSSLIVKTIWFIFVMSQLSVAENQPLDNTMEITDEIVSLLETRDDFHLVYTHHPAVLCWAFSSRVNSKIQTKIVHLWLQNKTQDCKKVEQLLKKSLDFRYAILDTLQYGSDQLRYSAFLSMKSVLVNSESDDLASNIWYLLPQVLANFTIDDSSAKNVDYLIELSSLQCPKNIEVTTVIQIASLLPQVLFKSDLTSVPYFTLALKLLQLGLKMEEYRVAFAFLTSQNFVRRIIENLSFSVSDISLCIIRIVTLLWRDYGKEKELEKPLQDFEKIKLRKKTVLQILETNAEENLSAALDFIQQLLVTNFQSTFCIVENIDLKFLEMLFLEIQIICIRTSAKLSDACWQCLKSFLNSRISSKEPIHLELSTHPVLYELIKFHLPRLKDSKDMADFLMVWIDVCNEKFQNPCYLRRIFGQFYAETMGMIARSIMQDFTPHSQDLLEKVRSPNDARLVLTRRLSTFRVLPNLKINYRVAAPLP